MELLQIKFGIFEYSREATIFQVETENSTKTTVYKGSVKN